MYIHLQYNYFYILLDVLPTFVLAKFSKHLHPTSLSVLFLKLCAGRIKAIIYQGTKETELVSISRYLLI